MDWHISRPPDILWNHVQVLKDSQGTTVFHDIILYCSDGALPWNRLLVGLCLPSCAALLDPQFSVEVEVAVSLPDFSVWKVKELLEASLPQAQTSETHRSLVPRKVSYTLVSGQEEDVSFQEESDIHPGDGDSDGDIKPDIQEDTTVKKKVRRGRKRKRNDTSIPEVVHHSIFTEEVVRGKRQRKQKVFDDFEYTLKTSQPKNKGFIQNGQNTDLDDIKGMKQLWKNADVYLPNFRLTEEQLEYGFVDLEDLETDMKLETEDHPLVPTELLIPVDSTYGSPESEEVEQHITRFLCGEKIIKQCNICTYKTYRSDTLTMVEHLFSHFPDICGYTCPVCRKPSTRKNRLMEHMEKNHTSEMLILFGIETLEQYAARFDSDSEEQEELRNEQYCRIECNNCKHIFYSANRMNLHLQMDLCQFVNTGSKQKSNILLETGEPILPANRKKKSKRPSADKEDEDEIDNNSNWAVHDNEDSEFIPKKEVKRRLPVHPLEQLSIDTNIPGLLEGLRAGAPFKCVVPSCVDKFYESLISMKRHYVKHDPEMSALLVCPICGHTVGDDRPGNMKKHVVEQHGKDDNWATENVIIEVSNKLQLFREAIQVTKGPKKQKPPAPKENSQMSSNKLCQPFMGKIRKYPKMKISLDDPQIRHSFEKGGIGGVWTCGVPSCGKIMVGPPYDLKKHYGKHDPSIRSDTYECNFCSFSSWTPNRMNAHLKEKHEDVLFLEASGKTHYKRIESEGWLAFVVEVNKVLENNPFHKGKDWREHLGYEERENNSCNLCLEKFNTKSSFEDHKKVHLPHLIAFNCPVCDEGFAIESVFKNHSRAHSVLYDRLKQGIVRCNACSQHFPDDKEAKKHLSIHHMNFMENKHFCETCSDWFMHKSALTKHMWTHEEVVFKCPKCQKRFFHTQQELDHHMAEDNCKLTYKRQWCKQCNEDFITPGNLKRHKTNVHGKIYQFQCNICKSLYMDKYLMSIHVRKTHKVPSGPIVDYYTYLSREEAMLLDVKALNARKPKGRSGKASQERLPCPYNCGRSFKKTGMKFHKDACLAKPKEGEEEVEYEGEFDDSQYSLPIAVGVVLTENK